MQFTKRANLTLLSVAQRKKNRVMPHEITCCKTALNVNIDINMIGK